MHLGRLAAFYPACRQCPHRDDTGSLSPRQVEQLAETSQRGQPPSLFHDEGAGGVYLNDLTPAMARDLAAAFGMIVSDEGLGIGDRALEQRAGFTDVLAVHHSASIIHPSSTNPCVLLAGDGRPITAELVAAAGEGLRWSGCDVIDIGPATAACLALAVSHLQAAGGVMVGNPGEEPHRVGLQFWVAGPRPLSAGGSLEPLVARYQARVSRPSRSFGVLHRYQADIPYLATLAEHYHALRPLRVAVDSASQPLLEYLAKLTAAVACQIIPCRASQRDWPEKIRAEAAHLAVRVNGDGETCRVFDENGQAVPTDRLLLLLAPDAGSVVLERATPRAVAERLEQKGVHVVLSDPRRADMAAAMREHRAAFGGGPSGRLWHAVVGVPLPDALMTITRLLALLSRSDQPFSVILDGLPAAG